MKMMAMGGTLIVNERCKDQQQERFTKDGVEENRTFQFPLPYDWHYNINLCRTLPLVEGTTMTTRWEMCVFSFLLAISKVNAYLTYHFFCKPNIISMLQEFCHKLASHLIKNRWIMELEVGDQQEACVIHQLMKALPQWQLTTNASG